MVFLFAENLQMSLLLPLTFFSLYFLEKCENLEKVLCCNLKTKYLRVIGKFDLIDTTFKVNWPVGMNKVLSAEVCSKGQYFDSTDISLRLWDISPHRTLNFYFTISPHLMFTRKLVLYQNDSNGEHPFFLQ